MKKENNNKNGEALKARLKQWSLFQEIEKEQIESRQFETHPEADFLGKILWEGMLTIRFEADSYTADNDVAEFRRDDFVRMVMDNLIRYHWRLRHKHVYWVATTEFGESGTAHCHILVSFFPLKERDREIPDLGFIECMADDSLGHICYLTGCPRLSVDLNWIVQFDNLGLIRYFAKKEPGREDYKHFIWSTDVENSLKLLLKEIEEKSKEEAP